MRRPLGTLMVALIVFGLAAGCHSSAPGAIPFDSGSDGGADADTDVDADADTDSDSDGDEDCEDPTFGVEEACALPDEPCACDHYCNQEYFEQWDADEYYVGYYCYGRCDAEDEDYECPEPDEYCLQLGNEDEPTALCLPHIQVIATEWSTKVFPVDYTPGYGDYTSVDVSLITGEGSIDLDLAIAYDYPSTVYGDMVLIYFVQSSTGAYYYVELQIPVESWDTGNHPMWIGSTAEYNFYPSLYYVEPEGMDYDTYVETLTIDGSLNIAEAPLAGDCSGSDCPVASGGLYETDFVGFRALLAPYEE